MTLVLNEIHVIDGLRKTIVVAAADRLLTTPSGKYYATHPKLFKIPYLSGAISYFGLAAFPSGGKVVRMWEWLPEFIRKNADCEDFQTFTARLHERLTSVVPASILAEQVSGFQMCGYNAECLPEYWFLSNIREMKGTRVSEKKASYKAPAPVFLGDHARRDFGWNGVDLDTSRNAGKVYRHGDFEVHAVVSDLFDEMFERVWSIDGFNAPRTPREYRDYVAFKMKFIVSLYAKWASPRGVGGGIDIKIWEGDAERRIVMDHSGPKAVRVRNRKG